MARRSRPQQGPIQPATAEPHAPALPFPVEVFPTPLRRFIREVAEALPCPPDFVGVPLLAVLGTAIGTSRVLEVKPGWLEGPRLFAAVVAEPGSKKSPALALVMQPVRERQQRLQAAAQHARPAEEGDDVQQSGGLPLAGDPRETPPVSSRMMPQLYTTDATLEALIQLLHQNPRGLLFVRDELTGWILGMNMYKNLKGNDRQHWLSLWNGDDIVVNRKTRKEVTVVPNPFVCVTGALPTEVIGDLEDARGRRDGLLARLLFAVPDPLFSGACPTGLCASAEHQGQSAGRDGAPVAPSPWRGVYGARSPAASGRWPHPRLAGREVAARSDRSGVGRTARAPASQWEDTAGICHAH